MDFKKVVPYFLLLLISLMNAQQKQSDFTAFGKIPTEVNPARYQQLKEAKNPRTRLAQLDTIAQIFLKEDYADSVAAYGAKIRQEVLLLSAENPGVPFYNLRALYYEGIGKREMGFLEDATSAFIKGIEKTSAKDQPMRNYLHLGLAETYLLKGEPKKAKAILEAIKMPVKNFKLAISVAAAKGDYFFQLKKANQARSFYKKGLHTPEITKFPKLQLRLQLGLAKINLKLKKLPQALAVFKEIKAKSLQQGFYKLYVEAVLNEGSVYRQQKAYQLAETALSMAYVNAVSWNRLELQKEINQTLVQLYVEKKDYKNAYSLMTQYASINYRIATKQNAGQVRELEFKYESLKKEREIQDLQKTKLKKQSEINRQKTIKNAILIGFLILLVPIILLLVVYYQKLQAQSELNKQQEIVNQQEMQAVLQSQELKLAKTAIAAQREERHRIAQELHDSIGGNLAAIKLKMNGLPTGNQLSAELMAQLDKTYEQVREISHSLIPKEFKEQAFTDLVGEYIRNLDQDQQVDIQFNAYPEGEINKLDEKFLVTLFNMIKELVTNAMKHAKANQIEIQLSFLSEEKSISLLYEDDGLGFDPEKTKKGIGLKNLQKRVRDLNGTLALNSRLQHGTVISINFPQS